MVHWLASELFKKYDSPMPAFTLMGEQGSALLDSALALPQQSAFGEDAYPSIFDKAAVLFRSLIKNHALVDGNKRLAVMATFVFLSINRYILLVSPSDLVNMALNVADSPDPSLSDIAQWLRRHSLGLMAKREELLKLWGLEFSQFKSFLRLACIIIYLGLKGLALRLLQVLADEDTPRGGKA